MTDMVTDPVLTPPDKGLKREQAASLPEGWMWESWPDGSGYLRSPDKEWFSYVTNISGMVVYKRFCDEPWESFYGSFSEFKKYAENTVQMFLGKYPDLAGTYGKKEEQA